MGLFCKCKNVAKEEPKPAYSDKFITAKYLLEHIEFKELQIIYCYTTTTWVTVKYKDICIEFTPIYVLFDYCQDVFKERDEILEIIKRLEEKRRQSILDKLIDEKIESDKKPTKKRK